MGSEMCIRDRLVVEDNYGMKSVNYNGLVGVLFSAVKELSTKLKEIENK